ncbi:hypothetical protein PISMIDRAFT_673246 [Pisolithus microcarpus 441]|uniref:Unplaced genomic scaffold scaffold_7, whole genome shotgun sequence n=1 Tax=Pisolithus microcarpus 441 TaxID=765257 RepID=A0A0C9ZSG4_9AGAM|nr:hypothetical protein PISMIDRAFT_673246 [Pisolithus microcarpus 441]
MFVANTQNLPGETAILPHRNVRFGLIWTGLYSQCRDFDVLPGDPLDFGPPTVLVF